MVHLRARASIQRAITNLVSRECRGAFCVQKDSLANKRKAHTSTGNTATQIQNHAMSDDVPAGNVWSASAAPPLVISTSKQDQTARESRGVSGIMTLGGTRAKSIGIEKAYGHSRFMTASIGA
jgi:hypothetical protein